MVDKVWSDWQNNHPANNNLFSGGSIGRTDTPEGYDMFPVGAPPDLNVRLVFISIFPLRVI